MMVMPANNTGIEVGYLAGRYAGRMGHLYGPRSMKGPYPYMPYALDNDRFSCWSKGKAWEEPAYVKMLEFYAGHRERPLWAAVPDVVADREATLREWEAWAPRVAGYGFPLAFVVQDGMQPADVPGEAAAVFVGGSTEWKWKSLPQWCRAFPRVHVGRVNYYGQLWTCHELGAETCDGTGWFRGDPRQTAGLWRYLAEASGEQPRVQHPVLFGVPA